jgi:hypothetical protein
MQPGPARKILNSKAGYAADIASVVAQEQPEDGQVAGYPREVDSNALFP